ncbi:caspase family protein [Nocardiopsis sp. FR26]|uniref:caspase family protein n=1 Tax=Nocardiopsis sp. FR26 TaxID=2605987 RepID=UPI001359F67C|nr:caspase family protein [Nocardiopsis sp. FR26]
MSDSRYALIVANDEYRDEGLRRLLSPAKDAVALAGVLSDPRIGGFEVQVARNEPSHSILMRVDDFFADRRPGDALILHFSCHGLKNASSELFFAATNTVPHRLASTAVPADFVRRCMAACRARCVVLFLDCCYGGAFSQGMGVRAAGDANVLDAFAGEKLGGGRGWAVITASNSMEYAFEGTALTEGAEPRPSVFTHALVTGLRTGEADLDEDGRVSLDELYEYVFDRVRRENPHQTPSRSVDLQGDLYLARSSRRRITPAPLPGDLRAAVASPDPYTRRGAVAELRFRMGSPDLRIALGAREALLELARTDITSIAHEAGLLVGEVALSPSPTVLEFGRVPQNSPPPHRLVRLLGPPLARNCVPHPEDDRIRVRERQDALEVSVDTSRPGALSGAITLRGPAGESVVLVTADVVPLSDRADTPAPPSPKPRRDDTPPERPVAHRSASRPAAVPATGREAPSAWVYPRAPAAALAATAVSAVFTVRAVLEPVTSGGHLADRVGDGEFWDEARSELDRLTESGMVADAWIGLLAGAAAVVLASVTRRGLRAAGGAGRNPGARAVGRALPWVSGGVYCLILLCSLVLLLGFLLSFLAERFL